MADSILSIIDRLVASPGDAALLGELEERAPNCGPSDQALLRRYIEFEKRAPSTFTIETVLACNLRCPECAIGGGLTSRPKKILGYDEFSEMFGKVRDWARYTYLHLWGEPFLNRDILEMTRAASATSRVNLSTNALLLREEQIPSLIGSGVSDLIVSIDGATQEVYERYRVGGRVDEAFRALRWIAEENLRQGRRVNVIPQFVVFAHNQHEIGAFRARCEELGLTPSFKAPYLRGWRSKFRASARPEHQRRTWEDMASLREAISGCVNPADVLTVDVRGNAILCCHDYDGEVSFGNLLRSDFREIWDSPRYRKARWDIATGRPPRFCETKCMSYFLTSEYPVEGRNPPLPPPRPDDAPGLRINLCGGTVKLPGWTNVDLSHVADIRVDLESGPLPWEDGAVEAIACISALNYFTPERALEIVRECLRVLRPGGILRVGVQDLRVLARRYLERDAAFFEEKLQDGRDRFPGETYADKFCNWFYGFQVAGKSCRYVYDYESLANLVRKAGFEDVRERPYRTGDLPDVEKLDNRPEQMFFLEARKGPIETESVKTGAFAEGIALVESGRAEEGWQLILEEVRAGTLDGTALEAFLPLVDRFSNEAETIKIMEHLSARHPVDAVRSRIEAARRRQAETARRILLETPSRDLFPADAPRPANAERIAAGLAWLLRSEEATGRRGSSSYLDFRTGYWGAPYPETTGYIVATLLRAATCTGSPELADVATRMGRWLRSIQEREGGLGEAAGSFATHPRVFNSGQAMLGWLALHKAGRGDEFLDSARRCGDWLARIQDEDGKWSRSTYAGPKPYHSRVGWALLELFAATGDERHLASSTRHLSWTMSQALPNGCFRGNSLSEPDRPWTHLIGYVLFGLVEQVRLRKLLGVATDPRVLETLVAAGDALAKCHEIARERGVLALAATYDMAWNSEDRWSCTTGDSQIAHFLLKLSHRTGDPRHEETARRILSETSSVQFLSGSLPDDVRGGLPGSFPPEAPYLGNKIPNWGVKFFVDALLELEHPSSNSFLIG